MCDYCKKITQKAYILNEGYDLPIGYQGEAFINYLNDLIIHFDGVESGSLSFEVNIPLKYCPWCGAKLDKKGILKYVDQDVLQEVLQPAT